MRFNKEKELTVTVLPPFKFPRKSSDNRRVVPTVRVGSHICTHALPAVNWVIAQFKTVPVVDVEVTEEVLSTVPVVARLNLTAIQPAVVTW